MYEQEVQYLQVYTNNGKKYMAGWLLKNFFGLSGLVYQSVDNYYEVTDELISELCEKASDISLRVIPQYTEMTKEDVALIARQKKNNNSENNDYYDDLEEIDAMLFGEKKNNNSGHYDDDDDLDDILSAGDGLNFYYRNNFPIPKPKPTISEDRKSELSAMLNALNSQDLEFLSEQINKIQR